MIPASERGDTLGPRCPARMVLDRIGDGWAMTQRRVVRDRKMAKAEPGPLADAGLNL